MLATRKSACEFAIRASRSRVSPSAYAIHRGDARLTPAISFARSRAYFTGSHRGSIFATRFSLFSAKFYSATTSCTNSRVAFRDMRKARYYFATAAEASDICTTDIHRVSRARTIDITNELFSGRKLIRFACDFGTSDFFYILFRILMCRDTRAQIFAITTVFFSPSRALRFLSLPFPYSLSLTPSSPFTALIAQRVV